MSKREADDDLSPVPTLGQVATETRFELLCKLLKDVTDVPVTELGADLRVWIKDEAAKKDLLPLALAFLGACDARAKAASLKRANVGSDEIVQGEHQRFPLFFLFSSLAQPFLFSSTP